MQACDRRVLLSGFAILDSVASRRSTVMLGSARALLE